MFVDTHSHIYLPEFNEDIAAVVQRAITAGVTQMLLPNVGVDTIAPMRKLASKHPATFSMAMGLHPSEVLGDADEAVAQILGELQANRADYCAVGEIGIDLYWDKTYVDKQMQVFELQLSEAQKLNLPVIIHCRDGLSETLEVLQEFPNVRAVFHCFGGGESDVEKIRRVGDYYFGIGGVVTFKNSGLRNVLPAITLDRILLETDAPYLAPTPHRGKRNESSYIPLIAATVAATLEKPVADVAEITSCNANTLFNLHL